MFNLKLYILLSMVGAMFDDFRAFQTAFKAFHNETNQLFVVKKSKSVNAVNKKLYKSVILLYLTYASRNFFTSACVAVMWHIPPILRPIADRLSQCPPFFVP